MLSSKVVKRVLSLVLSLTMITGMIQFYPGSVAEASGMSFDYAPDFETVFEHYITVEGTKLMDGEEELKFASLNYPQATSDSRWEQENAIKTIKMIGGNVTRTYTIPVWNGTNGSTAYVSGVDKNGILTFNEDALNKLDQLLAIANEYGIRLIIPLVDHWHWVGGMDGYVMLATGETYGTSSFNSKSWQFYSDPTCLDYFKQMLEHLMNRVNTVNGVKYKDDPAVLCWETGNELGAYNQEDYDDALITWTNEVVDYLKELGAKQCVLDGRMSMTPRSASEENHADILGCHYYTGNFALKCTNDTRTAFAAGKPFILGEFGTYTTAAPCEAVFEAGYEAGTNGIMMWSLRAHMDGYGYYWHDEDPGNWASYHWPGFESGDYYGESGILRVIYRYAQLMNGGSGNEPIPAPETEEAPLLYDIATTADIKWRGTVGGAWYEIQRTTDPNPDDNSVWVTIAGEAEKVNDCGRPGIAGFHDTSAISGESYAYRLRACNESGTGPWSNIVKVQSAVHYMKDDLSLIAVSKTDQNSSEVRNVYSYDHSTGVTTSGGTLKNNGSSDGYISYASPIPMTDITITAAAQSGEDPYLMVSEDGVVYEKAKLTAIGNTYTADLPEKVYQVRVYLPAKGSCILDSIEINYSYSGDTQERKEVPEVIASELIQDNQFDKASPEYAAKSDNLSVITADGITGLGTTDDHSAMVIYRTFADMTSWRTTVYGQEGYVPTVEISSDGVTYISVEPTAEENAENGWTIYSYGDVTVTDSVRYVKITYPKGQGKVIVTKVEAASGDKRLPVTSESPVNVIEDGEYYFGDNANLSASYTRQISEDGTEILFSKQLNGVDFTPYDTLYAWIKSEPSDDVLVLSFTDSSDHIWEISCPLADADGVEIFEFKDFVQNAAEKEKNGEASMDFSSLRQFSIGVRTASQKDGAKGTVYLDNIYVGNLTKVDDYEGYSGSDVLLRSGYSRNANGGSFDMSLSSDVKKEGSFSMKAAYNYKGTGYAGVTRTMDYLNLKDYDGISLWYVPDGSGNTVTFQMKTADGLSWETTGVMDSTGPTVVYIPFEQFNPPSWDSGRDSASYPDKSLDILEFSIYTNQGSGSSVTEGTLYFDDIRGGNVKEQLESAAVTLNTEAGTVISDFPYEISGTASGVEYVKVTIGDKAVNVPVSDDGTWSCELNKADRIYNTENLIIRAGIYELNGTPVAEESAEVSLAVEGNDFIEEAEPYNYIYNGDMSEVEEEWPNLPIGWTVSMDSENGDSVKTEGVNAALVWWSQGAFTGSAVQTVSGLPDGYYRLSATIKAKSGLENARMRVVQNGEIVAETPFIDTEDVNKTIELEEICIRGGKADIEFYVEAKASEWGLTFAVDDVKLVKTGDPDNYVVNGDMSQAEEEWPNLPVGWEVSYTGGDGWSPVKTQDGIFVGYADNTYGFTLSQTVENLENGIYKLSADMHIQSEASAEKFALTAKDGDTVMAEQLSTAKGDAFETVVIDEITVKNGKLTVEVTGEGLYKAVFVDNIALVRIGELSGEEEKPEEKPTENNCLMNGDMSEVEEEWPNLPVGWKVSYTGGDGWSPVKTQDGIFVGYADNPYDFVLSQTVENLENGIYRLSADMRIQSEASAGKFALTVKNGDTVTVEQLSTAKGDSFEKVIMNEIVITEGTLTVEIVGEDMYKAAFVDNIVLVRTGDLPESGLEAITAGGAEDSKDGSDQGLEQISKRSSSSKSVLVKRMPRREQTDELEITAGLSLDPENKQSGNYGVVLHYSITVSEKEDPSKDESSDEVTSEELSESETPDETPSESESSDDAETPSESETSSEMLSEESTPESKPDSTRKDQNVPDKPNTGDTNAAGLYAGLILLALISGVAVIVINRKKVRK